MRVTVWGINYAPEQTGIAPYNVALCGYLRQRGHDVRMLTSFCYYPAWRKLPGDKGRLIRTDVLAGVPVHRVWHYVPSKVSPLKRILHEGTFVTLSALRFLALPRSDVLVVVSPPLLLGTAAWLVTRLRRAPFVFHVQDLQPDAAAGLGMLKPGPLLRALHWLEKFAYAKAARVSGIMPGMLDAFRRKGVSEEKIFEFPNGVTLPDPARIPPRGIFRARNGFQPGDFIALYSGNLGVKQGLDVLVEAGRHLKNFRVKIVLCGDGAQKEALANQVASLGLKNIIMLPLQPEQRYYEMLVDADVCLITQQKGSGKYFFPSKLLTTLAFAKPVVCVADAESELAQAVWMGCFGINVEPGQPTPLARELERLAGDATVLDHLGKAGREYVARFDSGAVLGEFERLLREVGTGVAPTVGASAKVIAK